MINKSQGHQVPEYRSADLHRVNTAHDRHAQGKAEERRPRPAPVLSACPGPQATALQDGAPRSEHGLGGIFEIPLLLLKVSDSERVIISQERVRRSAPENSRLQGSVRALSPDKPRTALSPPCGRKGAVRRLCPAPCVPAACVPLRPPSLSALLLPSQLRAASGCT